MHWRLGGNLGGPLGSVALGQVGFGLDIDKKTSKFPTEMHVEMTNQGALERMETFVPLRARVSRRRSGSLMLISVLHGGVREK